MSSSSLSASGERQSLLNQNEKVTHAQYDSINANIEKDNSGDDVSVTALVTRKYWYRWYICLIFSLMGMLQGAVWNTWSPIDESAECVYHFSSNEIDQLTNWGPIVFLFTMPIFMWMLHGKGLRLSVALTAFFVAIGTGLRCLPFSAKVMRYFMHAGQIFNGAAGCVVMAAPTLLSNVWFPPSERVTATSISTLLNYMGTGVGYILGPLMVQQPSRNHTHNGTLQIYDGYLGSPACNDTHENKIMAKQIKNLMYLEFGFAAFLFISILAYFPNKPKFPPSASASVERMHFKEGLLALRRRKTFLVVTFTFSLTVGSYGGWTGVMSVIMNPLGVSQDEASRLGFFMTLTGCAVGMIVGWFADRIKGRMKIMIIILFIITFFAYLYYIIISKGWFDVKGLRFSQVGFWIVCIVIGMAMNAAVPLAMEMATDAAYPTSEAVSTSVLVWCLNVLNFVLILVLQVTNPAFTNYLMLSFIGVSIPLLIFFAQEPMNRMRVDMGAQVGPEPGSIKAPLLDDNLNVESDALANTSTLRNGTVVG